jgi:GTPase SAR1 family protein
MAAGEFSSGKSTLVNAFCREKLLPDHANATTSVVTRLVHGRTTTASVSLADGSARYTLPKDAAALARALAEALAVSGKEPALPDGIGAQLKLLTSDQAIAPLIASLVLHRDAPILARGVEVIDPPGLNSTRPRDTALALTVLPSADLMLLLLPATQALTNSLQRVVTEHLRLRPRGVVFCLTKVDLLTDADVELLVSDTMADLRAITGLPHPALRLLAAGPALDAFVSGNTSDRWAQQFAEFEEDITALARKERELIIGEAVARQVDELLDHLGRALASLIDNLRAELNGLRGPPVEDLKVCLLPWPANGLRGVSRCSVSEEPLDDVWLLLAALQVCT